MTRHPLTRLAVMTLAALLGACAQRTPDAQTTGGVTPTSATAVPHAGATRPSNSATASIIASATPARLPAFTPPPASAIPAGPFGALVRTGRDIFTDTGRYAQPYVGNGLGCQNCHLDAGRRPNSAPLWAAYVRYPRYRAKNGKINSFAERLQGCFRFSMNGKAPAVDSEVIQALTAYAYWLATDAPTGRNLAGYGYATLPAPTTAPSYARGERVYVANCALCHGADGQGQRAAGQYVFPPLWGPGSFNWGAGMGNVNTAAGFIQANMPFSRGGPLTDQDAWDVAWFMDSHDRPQDPRFTGSVAATRTKYHASAWSLYGTRRARPQARPTGTSAAVKCGSAWPRLVGPGQGHGGCRRSGRGADYNLCRSPQRVTPLAAAALDAGLPNTGKPAANSNLRHSATAPPQHDGGRIDTAALGQLLRQLVAEPTGNPARPVDPLSPVTSSGADPPRGAASGLRRTAVPAWPGS